MSTCRLTLLACCALAATAAAGTLAELPGWAFAGEDRAAFTITRDLQVRHSGSAAAKISTTREPRSYGALVQTIDAGKYTGRRVRLSAWVKTSGVAGFAGLLMRVEGTSPQVSLAFDNMQDRPLRGSTEWTRHVVVLEVASVARRIHFGVMLSGPGTVWIDDGQLEIVDATVPTTGLNKAEGPHNTDFED